MEEYVLFHICVGPTCHYKENDLVFFILLLQILYATSTKNTALLNINGEVATNPSYLI